MKQFKLVLNSHSLSDYEGCAKRYELSNVQNLELDGEYYPFVRGALISKILELWYRGKKMGYSREKLKGLELKLWKIITEHPKLNDPKLCKDKEGDGVHLGARMMNYFKKYREESYEITAVEEGFSKVLYEDQYVQFVYEGRPDLIVNFGKDLGFGVIDHKTESMRNNLYAFNNQFMGYCWATETTIGLVNYIGLQKNAQDGDVLRRETFSFTDNQIAQWKDDTIRWYYQIMRSIVNKNYLRSWRCEGKYGICPMHKICEAPTTNAKLIQIRDYYKTREPYSSW